MLLPAARQSPYSWCKFSAVDGVIPERFAPIATASDTVRGHGLDTQAAHGLGGETGAAGPKEIGSNLVKFEAIVLAVRIRLCDLPAVQGIGFAVSPGQQPSLFRRQHVGTAPAPRIPQFRKHGLGGARWLRFF